MIQEFFGFRMRGNVKITVFWLFGFIRDCWLAVKILSSIAVISTQKTVVIEIKLDMNLVQT